MQRHVSGWGHSDHSESVELFVACQAGGSVHVIDIANRRHKQSFQAGIGCESLGFF